MHALLIHKLYANTGLVAVSVVALKFNDAIILFYIQSLEMETLLSGCA